MKKLLLIVIGLVLPLTFSSCYYDELPPENIVIPDVVSYSTDIQPIFNQSCIGCHNPGSVEPDLTNPNSYNILINDGWVVPENANGSVLYKSLIGDGAPLMPPNGALSDGKITLVQKWINQGALNN